MYLALWENRAIWLEVLTSWQVNECQNANGVFTVTCSRRCIG